ncbi:MAG TPA: metalloregulator ArsR/SmtB family transcription factor [Sedimentisphaerales bacterium]|nr:metalloregulator ArsR/SmtB family transcription factor [Sedimentisphaerales bacterium]
MRPGKPSIARSAGLLRSLSSANRIELLDALRDGPRNVGQLVARRRGYQSAVSKDLEVLHGCGLVSREKRGQPVVYSIPPVIERLCIELDAVARCTLTKQLGS